MILKTGNKSCQLLAFGRSIFLNGIYTLQIEGRMYSPQKRTIKIKDWEFSYYLDFPVLHFYKYKLQGVDTYYIYSCLAERIDGSIGIFNSHNSYSNGGFICLGSATDNGFICQNNLDMDEFVSLFWQTRFSTTPTKIIDFYKFLPTLWDDKELVSEKGGIKINE